MTVASSRKPLTPRRPRVTAKTETRGDEWRNNSLTRPSPAVRGGRRRRRDVVFAVHSDDFGFSRAPVFSLSIFSAAPSTSKVCAQRLIVRFHGFHSSSRDTRRTDRLSPGFSHARIRHSRGLSSVRVITIHKVYLVPAYIRILSAAAGARHRVASPSSTVRLDFVSSKTVSVLKLQS